jgi:AcrR family transcriptional regulator
MAGDVKRKRRYRSPRRQEQAEQTRRRILTAATTCFVERGFADTTIAAVAAQADVAQETVYTAYGNKPALLAEAVRNAARGSATEPILSQPGPAASLAATDQLDQLRLFAADIEPRLHRVGPLMAALEAAAAGHPQLAELHRDLNAARLRNLRRFVDALAANGTLRLSNGRAADTVWALASPQLHLLLTGTRGWSRRAYREWLTDTLAVTLLPGDPR